MIKLDFKEINEFIITNNSFDKAVEKYQLSNKEMADVISKYLTNAVVTHIPITNNIFYEMIQTIDTGFKTNNGSIGYINVLCIMELFKRASLQLDMQKILNCKYVIRTILVSDEFCHVSNFSDDQLKIIFDMYGEWLLKSTQRSMHKHIAILNTFKKYINSKDLEFVIRMATNRSAYSIYNQFDDKLNTKQKDKIMALMLLNNLSNHA